MSEINQKIKDIISSNDIVLFMKGTPDAPQCGFSMTVSNILKHLSVKYEGVNVLVSDELRQGIKILQTGQQYHNSMSKENLLVDVTL